MNPAAPPDRRKLGLATLAALGVALVVLVTAVLPAEYGIDPTGIGGRMGLTSLDSGANASTDPSGERPEATTPTLTLETFASSFPVATAQLLRHEGYLQEGDALLLPFRVDAENVTRVRARLEFTDANATPAGQRTRPDTFEIELKAPHGDVSGPVLVRSHAATSGAIGEAAYVVRQPPFPRELDAASLDDARAAFLRNDPPDTTLAGEWMARVTMLEAQDGDVQGIPLPGSGTAANDDGNDWTLTLFIETYRLDVAAKPGTKQRSDAVTLEVPAGGELEYKLLVSLGKRVDYSWRTNGPALYVDFHGEKTGDASGAFTRHRNGDYAQDAGTLVAPFDGRHGWFWRNANAQAVTLTLETRGQYEVIGRVG